MLLRLIRCFAVVLALLATIVEIRAQSRGSEHTTPSTLQTPVRELESTSADKIRSQKIELDSGERVTLEYQHGRAAMARTLVGELRMLHKRLHAFFGSFSHGDLKVRVVSSERFLLINNEPAWTRGYYRDGVIVLALLEIDKENLRFLRATLRHEYTHAVVRSFSQGRAPSWLEEGLAQWFEGRESRLLMPAFFEWLQENEPLSLYSIQYGFGHLEHDTIPAAYHQALIAVNSLAARYHFKKIRDFLEDLAQGADRDSSFYQHFKITYKQFDRQMYASLIRLREASQKLN